MPLIRLPGMKFHWRAQQENYVLTQLVVAGFESEPQPKLPKNTLNMPCYAQHGSFRLGEAFESIGKQLQICRAKLFDGHGSYRWRRLTEERSSD